MPKTRLATFAVILLAAATLLALPAAAERPLDTEAVQLAADGWSEVSPGAWTRTSPSGERQLKAAGREGMQGALGVLKQRAAALLDGGLASPGKARLFGTMLSLIEKIEADLTADAAAPRVERRGLGFVAAAQDPCFRSGSVSASANPGPTCGASASASASVSSNAWCSTECDVYAETYAESSCIASGGVGGSGDLCTKQGLNETCNASSSTHRPFQCWAAGAAYVYCAQEDRIDMVDFEETESCGSSSAPCEC